MSSEKDFRDFVEHMVDNVRDGGIGQSLTQKRWPNASWKQAMSTGSATDAMYWLAPQCVDTTIFQLLVNLDILPLGWKKRDGTCELFDTLDGGEIYGWYITTNLPETRWISLYSRKRYTDIVDKQMYNTHQDPVCGGEADNFSNIFQADRPSDLLDFARGLVREVRDRTLQEVDDINFGKTSFKSVRWNKIKEDMSLEDAVEQLMTETVDETIWHILDAIVNCADFSLVWEQEDGNFVEVNTLSDGGFMAQFQQVVKTTEYPEAAEAICCQEY